MKIVNFIFPMKYGIPKSLKVSHWLSQEWCMIILHRGTRGTTTAWTGESIPIRQLIRTYSQSKRIFQSSWMWKITFPL